MTIETRTIYHIPNGDRWQLVRDSETGRVFVRHEANVSSGGRVTDIEIGVFLSTAARAAKLSAEERTEIARKAAAKRWEPT